MKRFFKKSLAIVLVVFQIISLVPTASFAADDVKTVNVNVTISNALDLANDYYVVVGDTENGWYAWPDPISTNASTRYSIDNVPVKIYNPIVCLKQASSQTEAENGNSEHAPVAMYNYNPGSGVLEDKYDVDVTCQTVDNYVISIKTKPDDTHKKLQIAIRLHDGVKIVKADDVYLRVAATENWITDEYIGQLASDSGYSYQSFDTATNTIIYTIVDPSSNSMNWTKKNSDGNFTGKEELEVEILVKKKPTANPNNLDQNDWDRLKNNSVLNGAFVTFASSVDIDSGVATQYID